MQINFIFSDNVRIFCLSCNVKIQQISRNLVLKRAETRPYLNTLSVAQHGSGTRKTISWSVIVYQKCIQSMQFDSSNETSGKINIQLGLNSSHGNSIFTA